ncbi:fusion of 3-hydroxyacyl-CoA dehydrogenase and enoyl-CoA hydratase [Luminiphilus syltensis NOR5-1B]|uniref:Fusion of 3-hydroxyacyl-CoA dehydrogenase and enoyl-CoA hydratase n=1 Tax=Luminiphilus syltensis NOR5-1B TaxID=565045 RepID=B8KTX4_9GAMM|nr:3-hydroxyacyl-CoA dehydrogenase/enoyl-CoA hydratase family protein [Luminiphilus syltensis]EED36091.1 fusion of 3-hydroxyacyl-CoA dehydrogenase and enoyl-CoA hydratase [Luminiphilus syltensis NOR5-1B]
MPSHHAFNPALAPSPESIPTRVGIIGCGTIGPDIGYYLKSALPGLELVLIDVVDEALEKAVDRIRAYAAKGLDKGKLSAAQAEAAAAHISASCDYSALAGCEWVIEAATENLAVKRQIFSDVEAVVSDEAMITSNTSSLPAERLFSHLENPTRATVTHFFAPAFKNPAVEVIEWYGVSEKTVQALRWIFYATGKTPMMTSDDVCFMLDRIFDNWCNEAALLLPEATPAQIDSVAMAFVHAGPFHVLNLANGNPIIIETNRLQQEEEGDHYAPAAIFEDDPDWDTAAPSAPVEVGLELSAKIRDRLLGILFSQSADILNRNIGTPEDLDLGCRLAFGFREGPLAMMQQLGESEVRRIADSFAAWKPAMPRGDTAITAAMGARQFIGVDRHHDALLITLRRPDALNALHDEMTDEILDELERAEADPSIEAIIITGYGTQAFCSGADIGRFPSLLGDHGSCVDYARACSRLLLRMDVCKKPIIAALNGLALGGGLELALRCDAMVMMKDAYLQFPEISLGIAPGIGALAVPYRRYPAAAATFHDMIMKAERLSAADALSLGVVRSLSTDLSDLFDQAQSAARWVRDHGKPNLDAPVDVGTVNPETPFSAEVGSIMARAITDAAAAPSFNKALEVGYQAFGDTGMTKAAREGIDAFMERRRPDFTRTG